jgi:hypothetical protein
MLFADEDRLENPQSNVKQSQNFHCGLKRLFQHAIQEGARQVCISAGVRESFCSGAVRCMETFPMVSMPKTSSFALPSFYSYSQLIDPWICASL